MVKDYIVTWLQKETNCKVQVINNMVYKNIIADCADHCIQGPLPLDSTERVGCIPMCDQDASIYQEHVVNIVNAIVLVNWRVLPGSCNAMLSGLSCAFTCVVSQTKALGPIF